MVAGTDRAKRPARTSVWLDDSPRVRGRRHERAEQPPVAGAGTGDSTSLDRDRITEVSVALLDAEGPEKFSMRRLASELGVTAMSLYWYVNTKDDLLELSLDHVFGEVRVPDGTDMAAGADGTDMAAGAGPDWREHLRALAASYRSVFVRHPWASPLIGKYLNIGPCATVFSNAVRAVVRSTGLPAYQQRGAISAVFQFVYGFGTIEGHFVQRCADAGLSQDEYYRLAMGSIGEQIEERPGLREAFAKPGGLMEPRGGATVREMRERDFGIALDLLVAGIEALGTRAGDPAPAAGGTGATSDQ
ncbi:TetR/AcrR family transcriptional regulator [Streptomyces fuscigenes]|uniref:TetR/AcrR family transcriptional regulator n=1 Tax=Streptomyces fuscigenes TaxID=1528880 RepID=UPI001F322F9E|nr:TetR/AcrR family transcriptional regulator [Streptomyces fuscigenes]MCF3961965.1 TetR/AcrR family transcriptional regulator [Streptomyces fuscigenes]